ncbi:uncharacterized protein LOC123564500 [Mercenaria mercenaria]|uniref:uncharacterized protein LOC123564500 n=1 Tax=Mercenaria mercenaria TaxID=6596 RepID=UPI00234E3F12|nr:uncharacterized protein LOC123564500 [Mercenaria mercenaria]
MSSGEGEEPHTKGDLIHLPASSDGEISGVENDVPAVGANEIVSVVESVAQNVSSETGKSGKVKVKNTRKQKEKKTNKASQKANKKGTNKKTSKSKESKLDINDLSKQDIDILKRKLGFPNVLGENLEEESNFIPDYEDFSDENFDPNNRPNLRVEIDSNDISDSEYDLSRAQHENFSVNKNMSNRMLQAMFGSDSNSESKLPESKDEWAPPKLKSVVRGDSISPSLAKLIDMTCTSACCTEDIMQKYNIPQNCDNLSPPMVNQEVWKILDKKSRSYDRMLVEIQNLVATGIVPVIKLAEIMGDAMTQKAKEYISDAITMFGQVQYQLSLRRRYIIRPNLKRKYKNICNQSTPVTSQLFGDDISKEIKNCETGISLAFPKYDTRPFRARPPVYRNSFNRRGRPHPYNQQGNSHNPQYNNMYYQSPAYRGGHVQYRGRRRPTSTVTYASANAPNE